MVWPIAAGVLTGLGLFAIFAVWLLHDERRRQERGTSAFREIGSGHGDDPEPH